MAPTKTQGQSKRVAIIGGGWSGLYALKTTLGDGHKAMLFEKEDDIGGIWRYREDKPGGVWRGVHTVSSKAYLHASDFPMPDHYPLFPHHTQIMAYLRAYVDHFDLRPFLRLNHQIEQIVKEGAEWLITMTHNGEQKQLGFDAVIIAAGQAQVPAYPQEEMYQHFTGQVMHSHDYKYPTEAMQGKNILVIGGGESGSDIANEVSKVARCVYLSLRRGQWFMDRLNGARLPLDVRFSRKARYFQGDYGENAFGTIFFDTIVGLLFGTGGHGIDEWLPTTPILRGFVNKSRDVLQRIAVGKVIPCRGVNDVRGQFISFEGGSEPQPIDMIIFTTGFVQSVLFSPGVQPTCAYKFVFDPNDPTLAYVGTVRPVFGSVPALAELQARWISAVFRGDGRLPPSTEMKKIIESDISQHRQLFPADHDRLPYLVSHFKYADYILHQLGALPNLRRLFFTDNKKWRLLMNAPWTPFEVLLNDPQKGEHAYGLISQELNSKNGIKRPSLFRTMLLVMLLGLISVVSTLYLVSYLLLAVMR